METWDPAHSAALHTSSELADAWDDVRRRRVARAALGGAARSPRGHARPRGREVLRRARASSFPGRPGSAPPLLAQHDWVHVLADYGSTVECEIEVFAFVSRGRTTIRAGSRCSRWSSACSRPATWPRGAGLFEYDRGSSVARGHGDPPRRRDAAGRAVRVRTAAVPTCSRTTGSPTPRVRSPTCGPSSASCRSRSSRSSRARSTAWEPGGISPYQYECGRKAAEAAGREYDSYGARPVE